MQGYDKGTIKHKLNVLEKRNIILFNTADWLQYKTISTGTTITVTQLPPNTFGIFFYYSGYGNPQARIWLRRKSTDTVDTVMGIYNDAATNYIYNSFLLGTDDNTFYCYDIKGTIIDLYIYGYMVR